METDASEDRMDVAYTETDISWDWAESKCAQKWTLVKHEHVLMLTEQNDSGGKVNVNENIAWVSVDRADVSQDRTER